MNRIPDSIKALLWEYDIRKNNPEKIERIVIERVLQFGDLKQLRWAFKNIGYARILEYFSSRGWQIFSDVNYNYWFHLLKDFKINNIDWQKINTQRLLLKKKNKFWKY